MAGALHHADLLALDRFGANVLELVVFARDEPAGRRVVAAREVGLGERVGVNTDRGDGGVGLAVVEVLNRSSQSTGLISHSTASASQMARARSTLNPVSTPSSSK